ncbi:MAG: DUF4282 domain-containing protein [Planctomycetota bacterium]|jgi:hypothetical protein
MNEFLAFRKMLTPVIIQALFWIGLLMIAVFAFSANEVPMALVMIVSGAIMWRVYCEILIVIFRILDSLTDIKNKP